MTKKQMVMTSFAGRGKNNNDTRHLIAKLFMTAEILERKTNEEAATVMRLKNNNNKKHVYVCQPHCRIEQSPVVFRLTQER